MNDVRQLFIEEDGTMGIFDMFRNYAFHRIGTWTDVSDGEPQTVFFVELDGYGSRIHIDMFRDRVQYITQQCHESRGKHYPAVIAILEKILEDQATALTILQRISDRMTK